jgi:methyltransferase (TIGR00027 family)
MMTLNKLNGNGNGFAAHSADDVRWEDGRKFRYDSAALTNLLRGQVPVLDYVKWGFESIEQGQTLSVLPLISSATNQHCTHQAALLFLAADYTGGIALASLFPDWPLIGIHPIMPSEKSMSLWLAKGEIKYLRPSVGRLEIAASVDTDRHARIRNRCAQGKTILETVTVRFRNGSVDVAEANMTYFGRASDKLRGDSASPDKINILFEHKIISSAELIAGVRARESGRLFDDPFAARMAGEHGVALAARFCEKMPQLGGMVAARTRHLDQQIQEFIRNGGRDLVLVGAGYDMRPFRLNLPGGMRVYELDLPPMLADRQRRIERLGIREPEHVTRVRVPIDLRETSLVNALKDVMDVTSPIFIAWEGMTMYFEEPEVRMMLAGMAPLLTNNRSRLWFDVVDRRAVVEPEIFPELQAFMSGMQMLGEPFVFGVDSPQEYLESNGLTCHQCVPSDLFLRDTPDPVYSIYHFCTASADAAVWMNGQQPSWTAHGAHSPLPAAVNGTKAPINDTVQH